jgi:hypothetical protein
MLDPLPQTALEEKQRLLAHYVRLVAKGHSNGLFVAGAGGLGKSRTIAATLAAEGVRPIIINSHITPLSLYQMHFDKGQTPSANGFWSLTMYDGDYFFVPNRLNRYTLSPRDTLKYNEDGSLDLYFQKDSPGAEKEANWLPSPPGKFILMLRLYWPKDAVLDGSWKIPAVNRVR